MYICTRPFLYHIHLTKSTFIQGNLCTSYVHLTDSIFLHCTIYKHHAPYIKYIYVYTDIYVHNAPYEQYLSARPFTVCLYSMHLTERVCLSTWPYISSIHLTESTYIHLFKLPVLITVGELILYTAYLVEGRDNF